MEKSSEGSIEEFLKSLETKYGVTIILALETGGRAHGLHTDQSDHDLKGLYVSTPKISEEIYKKGIFDSIKQTGNKFRGFKVPLDIEFVELKTFCNELKEGQDKNLRWFFSDMVYRDKYPEIRETILGKCELPRAELMDRLTKDVEKAKRTNNMKEVRRILNMLVDALLLTWFQRQDAYPPYKLSTLAEKLKSLDEKSGGSEEFKSKIDDIMGQIQQLYFLKKKAKHREIEIDESLLNFVKSVIEDDAKYPKTRSHQFTQDVITDLLKKVGLQGK